MLGRNPGFTGVAVAALALGIGANSAIFSVIYGVLLKPLPYRDPERLVKVYELNPVERFQSFPLSPADFQDHQFGGEHPERLIGARVSYGFFRLFGAEPMLGRAFTQEEEQPGGPTNVAIISHNVWKRLF